MSRLFDDASSEYLQVEQAIKSGAPLAVSCWFNTNVLSQLQMLFWVGDKDTTNNSLYLFLGSSDFVSFASRTTLSRNAITTLEHTANNWHHACGMEVSATDRRCLLDGANKGTNATSSTPSGLERTSIGMRRSSVPDFPMSGMIAEVGVWDLSAYPGATASDKADYFEANILPHLAANEKPSTYQTGLIAYWPFETSSLEDEAGEFDLTASGTAFDYDHPSVWRNLGGVVAAQSALTGGIKNIESLGGLIEAQSALTGNLNSLLVFSLGGTISGQSALTGHLHLCYAEIPPFMEKDLIDPYASGAWLWLAEIVVPTQDTVRIARNTEDVRYAAEDFNKHNIQIGEQVFSGDGSIPRITLRTFQDSTRQIENIINETEGALGGTVKLIRVNEKWLDVFVDALEADYDLLASQSDSEWCTFTLGIPNPLTQRYPLRDFSSSICPWTSPELYKGPECQCVHADTTCTGTYADCLSKGNATRWGGELGLSPSVIKESRQ